MPDRALVYSSDIDASRTLRQVLDQSDVSVDACTDAAAAIENLADGKYSLVIVDAPDHRERDGILQQLRCTPLNKDTFAIAVVSTQAHSTNAFAAGANFLLYRPLLSDRVRTSLKAAMRLIQRDRRRSKRASVHAQADISYPTVESANATLLDLSDEGLSLQCERDLSANKKIYLRFTLPGQSKAIQLSGETMWQDLTGRVGIRFVDVPQSARRLLREWLECKLSISESKVRVELPASASGRLASARSDRRSESRHTCRLGAEIYRAGDRVPHRCTLSDISAGGFYVETTAPFAIGTPVEVVVRTSNFKFSSAGTVQKVDRGFGMGVAFGTQTARQRAQVQELIKIAFRDREAEGDPILKW